MCSEVFQIVKCIPVLEQVSEPLWRHEVEQSDFARGQGELLAGVEQKQRWSERGYLWACWSTSN